MQSAKCAKHLATTRLNHQIPHYLAFDFGNIFPPSISRSPPAVLCQFLLFNLWHTHMYPLTTICHPHIHNGWNGTIEWHNRDFCVPTIEKCRCHKIIAHPFRSPGYTVGRDTKLMQKCHWHWHFDSSCLSSFVAQQILFNGTYWHLDTFPSLRPCSRSFFVLPPTPFFPFWCHLLCCSHTRVTNNQSSAKSMALICQYMIDWHFYVCTKFFFFVCFVSTAFLCFFGMPMSTHSHTHSR